MHPAFASIYDFLLMGGYAPYVWLSYASLIIILSSNLLMSIRQFHKTKKRLNKLNCQENFWQLDGEEGESKTT